MSSMENVLNGTIEKLDDKCVNATTSDDSNVRVTFYGAVFDKYKTEFSLWSKKTAQATLEMCRVVFEAKKELESQDFLKFCNSIGRKGEDATVRKYLRIGEKYEKFYQYADLLPNSWTSIYEITQLPSDVFEALVTTENSMANMTGDQLKLLMGKKAEEKSKSSEASTAEPTTAQSSTVKTSTETTEEINSASSKTDASETAVANSDDIQNDSSNTVADAEASTAMSSDESSNDADRDFARQATNTMLERVASTASITVAVEAEEDFEPYEIMIRFNSKPSDIAVTELVESLVTIKSKFRLDFEFVHQNACSK